MKIHLVSRDNGVGLSKDMDLLTEIFTSGGHQVARYDWRAPAMPRCDIAVFLELFNPALARFARRTIGIFNLEWFLPKWRAYLPHFSQLWAKSLECYEVMSSRWRLRNVHHTGFASRDLYDPAVPRELRCLHLAGHSPLKNTDAVLSAWRQADDLPPLTLVAARRPDGDIPPGVEVIDRYVTDAELAGHMNRASIHVCPSAVEGWGHYITEGLSVGALVLTTDGSPMNEQVRPEHGLLLPPSAIGRRGAVAHHHVDPGAIINAVRHAAAMPTDTRLRMGAAARVHLLARNARFSATALDLIWRA